MFQKRPGQESENETVRMAETARSAADGDRDAGKKPDDEKMSLFWRVFGGTILSIITLVGITIFNNVSSGIAELRAELNREREARAELVKKDEFNARTSSQYERIRAFDNLKADIEGLRERANTNAAAIDGLKKDAAAALDAARKELTALADSFKRDAANLEVLRDRLGGVEALDAGPPPRLANRSAGFGVPYLPAGSHTTYPAQTCGGSDLATPPVAHTRTAEPVSNLQVRPVLLQGGVGRVDPNPVRLAARPGVLDPHPNHGPPSRGRLWVHGQTLDDASILRPPFGRGRLGRGLALPGAGLRVRGRARLRESDANHAGEDDQSRYHERVPIRVPPPAERPRSAAAGAE